MLERKGVGVWAPEQVLEHGLLTHSSGFGNFGCCYCKGLFWLAFLLFPMSLLPGARPNHTLLSMHLHIVLCCAWETYPWITPSPSTDVWQLLLQQTRCSREEVIISPVVQKEGDEMQKSYYFCQVAERKCVSVTAAPMSSGCGLGGTWIWSHRWNSFFIFVLY